jgi:UDP-glucose 4-epimerase
MVEKNCKYIIKSSTAAVYGNPTKESDIPWKEDFVENYQPGESALLNGKWQEEEVAGNHFFDKFIDAYEDAVANRPELKLTELEKTKLRIPLSIYGLTKLLDEILLKKYDEISKIKFVSLRYFNVCGADPSGHMGEDKPKPTTLMTMAIYQLLGKISQLDLLGKDYDTPDGTAIRDYIHPSDLSVGHISALQNLIQTNKSDIFNLGTGKGSSVLEVIAAVERASGKKVKTVDKPKRSGDAIISVADPNNAKKVLNWQARYSLDDMAETAWKWHNSHPSGY